MNEVDHEKNGKRYRDPEWPLDDPVPMASKKMKIFTLSDLSLELRIQLGFLGYTIIASSMCGAGN